MKRIIFYFSGLLLLGACNSSEKIEIKGTLSNSTDKEIYLKELAVTGPKEIDKKKPGKKGTFRFTTRSEYPRFYHVALSDKNFLTLLLEPGEKVTIEADVSDLSKARISGSQGSVLVQKLESRLKKTKRQLDSLNTIAENIPDTPEYDQRIQELNQHYVELVDRQRDSSIAFILDNMNSLASIMALYQKVDEENYVLYKNRDLQFIKLVSEALEKKYPQSPHVKALIADKTNLMKRYEQAKTNARLQELTQDKPINRMPEIALPNVNGDTVSLNSIQAEYILLSFWASWSEESINQNLELLDIYRRYHPKGFEIYQVSLDTKKENWVKSINFDQLPWINVIDLNGRSSYYARIYNVQKIPTNYLINPEGEIVMVNPSKKELKETFDYALK
ncbi:MAG: thioredoxin-like domain-containing protein [Bacteroidales bacterium]|jgi:peroxiredoxin|nr:thioredoxin-like domain-containing protein [Bacteroidales bacterium]